MGESTSHICRRCGEHFTAKNGGGFMFDVLHCDTCGNGKSVDHSELGEIHFGYVKGLSRPYAVGRAASDRRIQAEFPGASLTRDEYEDAAEAALHRCDCGGTYRYGAPARCPGCRSTEEQWDVDPHVLSVMYD